MKTNKQIKVKYSPLFEEQLGELQNIIKEKDSKFHRQLLTAIEREKNNLSINPQHGIQIISVLLEFMDHKTYNKIFGYKQR